MTSRHSISAPVLSLVLACGCGSGDIDGPPFSAGATAGEGSAGEGSGANTGGAPSAGGSGALTPNSDPPLFDDEPPPAATEPRRCDKVDFLYVIDNSASMLDKQENLAQSFEGFTRVVTETLGTNDHHIMVIDTDGRNAGDVINGIGSETDECVGMLGAGRRTGAEGENCGVEGNQSYLVDEQKNLPGTFACLAKVGIYGSGLELPINALLTATGAMQTAAAGCNEGFLRDDAVLVVTLITDEEDEQSDGDPDEWKRLLLRVKSYNEQALVMLGLIGDNHIAGGLPGGPCDELSGSSAPRLESFVRSFELGALGSVCAPDYSNFFAAAVSSIDTACEEFVPLR